MSNSRSFRRSLQGVSGRSPKKSRRRMRQRAAAYERMREQMDEIGGTALAAVRRSLNAVEDKKQDEDQPTE